MSAFVKRGEIMIIKEKLNQLRENKTFRFCGIPILLIVVFLQYFVIEMSYSTIDIWKDIPIVNKMIGIATVFFLQSVLILLCKNVRVSLNISILLTTILAVANYYICKFRGTPFTFAQLQNIKTAMNVVGSYTFTLDDQILIILYSTVGELVITNFVYYKVKLKRRCSAILTFVLGIAMYISFLSANPLIPQNVVGWSWEASVSNYGYLNCLVKCTIESSTSVRMPENYNENEVQQFVENYQVSKQENNTPDIIFILNETFYDLEQATQLDTDIDPLEYIHSLENSLQGYCVVPCEGGGTNVSEYEFLTSNSIYLSPNSNPFNTIDIMNGNSFATYLESLGYTSLATHSEMGLNYARDVAFPALGFDTIHFQEDYTDVDYYYGRLYKSDECLYKNLIRWYEGMSEAPRVMYMLTIQNHANFDYLNEEEYLVHTSNDFGEYTNQINEFLTCIYLSDQAFKSLVEYYETVDRDVIICMVGDHAPLFVSDVIDEQYSEEERALRTRGVPYVIWSNNIDLSEKELSEWTSLPYLVPQVLQVAGVELSVYYDYIMQLQESVPIITSYGSYVTEDNQLFKLNEESKYTDLISRYYELAYANMIKADFMMNQP